MERLNRLMYYATGRIKVATYAIAFESAGEKRNAWCDRHSVVITPPMP